MTREELYLLLLLEVGPSPFPKQERVPADIRNEWLEWIDRVSAWMTRHRSHISLCRVLHTSDVVREFEVWQRAQTGTLKEATHE